MCTTLLRGRDFLRAFINFELGPLESGGGHMYGRGLLAEFRDS